MLIKKFEGTGNDRALLPVFPHRGDKGARFGHLGWCENVRQVEHPDYAWAVVEYLHFEILSRAERHIERIVNLSNPGNEFGNGSESTEPR